MEKHSTRIRPFSISHTCAGCSSRVPLFAQKTKTHTQDEPGYTTLTNGLVWLNALMHAEDQAAEHLTVLHMHESKCLHWHVVRGNKYAYFAQYEGICSIMLTFFLKLGFINTPTFWHTARQRREGIDRSFSFFFYRPTLLITPSYSSWMISDFHHGRWNTRITLRQGNNSLFVQNQINQRKKKATRGR